MFQKVLMPYLSGRTYVVIALILVVFTGSAAFSAFPANERQQMLLYNLAFGNPDFSQVREPVKFEETWCGHGWGENCYNYTYYPGKEHLKISLEHTKEIRNGMMFGKGFYSPTLVLKNSERKKRTNVWAEPSISQSLALYLIYKGDSNLLRSLPFIGNQGVDSFPLQHGEYVVITKDFTDRDRDGVYGVENNETITLYIERDHKTPVAEGIAYFSVTNDTARMFKATKYGYYNRTGRWIPCDLENQKRCISGESYYFEDQRKFSKTQKTLNMLLIPALQHLQKKLLN